MPIKSTQTGARRAPERPKSNIADRQLQRSWRGSMRLVGSWPAVLQQAIVEDAAIAYFT